MGSFNLSDLCGRSFSFLTGWETATVFWSPPERGCQGLSHGTIAFRTVLTRRRSVLILSPCLFSQTESGEKAALAPVPIRTRLSSSSASLLGRDLRSPDYAEVKRVEAL